MGDQVNIPKQVVSGGPHGPSSWRTLRPRWLYDAISNGSLPNGLKDDRAGDWPIQLIHLGSIPLPDGELVACDPFVASDHEPAFATRLLAGNHAVYVARAKVGPDHERNAAAVLVASDSTITTWQLALTSGQDPVTLTDPSSYFGYGVDAGTGCFGCPSAQAAATAALAADGGMLETPFANSVLTASAEAVISAPSTDAVPLAMFLSGWGDGSYPTWLGKDAAGVVVVAVTDFLLTTDPFAPPAPPSPPKTDPPPKATPKATEPLRSLRWWRRGNNA